MAKVTIKFQNSLNWSIWFTLTSYQCWLNPLKTQAIFLILAVLVIKRVRHVLAKLHAKHAIIRTLTMTYGMLQKNKRSSVLNLPKQRQVCPSLFLQFNMCISVIYHGLVSVLCKPSRERAFTFSINYSCGGSQLIPIWMKGQVSEACVGFFRWGVGWLGELQHLAILPLHCHFILFIKFS